MASWLEVDEQSGFSLQNLPYGIFSTDHLQKRIGVAIGDYIVDMKALSEEGMLQDIGFDATTLQGPTLNAFAALGKDIHRSVRGRLQALLSKDTELASELWDDSERRARVLVPAADVTMHLPMDIGDYTDFFVGLYHARNCTEIVRPGSELAENFFSQPIAYHGRASSVVVSGTPVNRPKGQFAVNGAARVGSSQRLDFEVELGAFIGRGNAMGSSIAVQDAEAHIFGFVLMNDWSARDIQFRESTPLGPFNGKNFATTISPWVVTPEAMEPFRTRPLRPRPLLPYLDEKEKMSVYDIPIRVTLEDKSGAYALTTCNTKFCVFSFSQMIAHHTLGGCPMRTGDLIATGTLSGPTRKEFGCFLELGWNGRDEYEMEALENGQHKIIRKFLEDGDIVTFQAVAGSHAGKVGFGNCKGQILRARD